MTFTALVGLGRPEPDRVQVIDHSVAVATNKLAFHEAYAMIRANGKHGCLLFDCKQCQLRSSLQVLSVN